MDIKGIDSVTTSLHSKLTNASAATQAKPSANPSPTPPNAEQTATVTSVAVSAPTASEDSPKSQGGLEKLRSAVEKIQEFVSSTASDIEFSVDEESGQTIVKVVDRETDEVIRQIPSQEMLDLAKALDRLQGLLIKQKA